MALKALPENMKSQPGAAQEGLAYCNRLFAIERELAETTPEERYREREKRSQPVLKEFHASSMAEANQTESTSQKCLGEGFAVLPQPVGQSDQLYAGRTFGN